MTYGEFAKIYDELIKEDIDYNLICDRIKELISIYNINNEDYLDLACGTGNVSSIMVKKFDNTYLVDMSEDMLEMACFKFMEQNTKAMIVRQDMTKLNLNHKFDLITCVLDSTNYILKDDELLDYFKGVYNHLKDEGIFIFDINSFYKLTNILGDNVFTYNEEDVFYTWENTLEDNIVNMFLTFFVKDNESDLYERFEEEHNERAYKEEEIQEFLKKANLKVLNKFDGYSNNEVSQQSERILYVVGKDNEQ